MVVVAWEKKLKEERIKWMLFVIFANGIEIWLTTYYRSKRYQSCNLGTILLAYPRYILCLYGRSSLSFDLLSTTTVSCAADEAFLELEGILTYILLTFFGWRMCWCVDVCVRVCTGQCDRSCSHWVLWQWTTRESVSLLTDITYPQVPFAFCHHELYLWASWIVYLACCKFTLCTCGLGYWQVHNFVSLGGPHAGTASVPGCAVRLILGFTEAPRKNYYFLCLFLL
jgi:hypothetical protein